ncbi:hypothetical protein BJV78DRAFT_1175668, partial [Lactifluus subvellereus]
MVTCCLKRTWTPTYNTSLSRAEAISRPCNRWGFDTFEWANNPVPFALYNSLDPPWILCLALIRQVSAPVIHGDFSGDPTAPRDRSNGHVYLVGHYKPEAPKADSSHARPGVGSAGRLHSALGHERHRHRAFTHALETLSTCCHSQPDPAGGFHLVWDREQLGRICIDLGW